MAISVKDGSTWRTVVEPYINVSGTWKTVHMVHIKEGGSWRIAHQTASSRYTQQSAIAGGSSGNYTVPNNGTRYVKAQVIGGGGGGGGGVQTSGPFSTGAHMQCPFSQTITTDYATGGTGGAGSNVIVILHVWPGNYIVWSASSNNGAGGLVGSALYLNNLSSNPTAQGSNSSGNTGTDGANMSLTVYNYNGGTSVASVIANGGTGGGGGTVVVSSVCNGMHESPPVGFSGYGISAPTGGTGVNGSSTISGNIDSTIQDSYTTSNNSSPGEPGVGNSNATGSNGRSPAVTLWPMTPNQS